MVSLLLLVVKHPSIYPVPTPVRIIMVGLIFLIVSNAKYICIYMLNASLNCVNDIFRRAFGLPVLVQMSQDAVTLSIASPSFGFKIPASLHTFLTFAADASMRRSILFANSLGLRRDFSTRLTETRALILFTIV